MSATTTPGAAAMDAQALSTGMRAAMRRLGATVSVVTVRQGEQRFAMTATSITSLSMDPPSLLVCVNHDTAIHPALSAADEFVVNILAAEQHGVASACGGRSKGEDRFLEGQWAETESRTPCLVNAQANLRCVLDGRFDYGTHTVFIGRVRHIATREEVNPLGYLNGAYIATQWQPGEPADPTVAPPVVAVRI